MEDQSYQDCETLEECSVNQPLEKSEDEKQELEPEMERRSLLQFLPVILFCFTFYCSVIGSYTIFPQYILHRLKNERNFTTLLENTSLNPCFVNKSDPVYQVYTKIQEDSSKFLASASFTCGVPNLVSGIIFGALSDKLGRKKIIYTSYLGQLILNIGLSLIVNLDLPLWIYYVLNFLNGCSGSGGTMLAAIFAHVADVTTKRQRALLIALVEFSIGLSMITINVVLGAVIKAFGFRFPMIGLSVLCVLSILLIIRVKESVPEMDNTISTCQVIRTPFARIKMLLAQNRRRSTCIIILTFAYMLDALILTSGIGVSTLYLMGIPFCWNSLVFGLFNALNVFSFLLCSFLVIVFCRQRFNNDNLILVGMVSFFSANIFTAMASRFTKPACDALMIVSIGAGIFASLPGVFIRSQASRLVRPDEQGAVFGLLSTGETFAFSFGATIASTIFGASVSFLAGLVYYFAAFLVLISIVLIMIYKVIAIPLRRSLTYPVDDHIE